MPTGCGHSSPAGGLLLAQQVDGRDAQAHAHPQAQPAKERDGNALGKEGPGRVPIEDAEGGVAIGEVK